MRVNYTNLVLSISLIIFSSSLNAQTTGPSQPEVLSSPSISGEGMVDLYTGNLNYNIPLLVVPGPDGGYPITLGYMASPSVNNVPTWVGYNWNINTGVIVRNKRGIPDDFNGDILEKTIYQKDKWNIGIGVSPTDIEIFGGDLGVNGQFSMYYDSYAGFGVKAGVSLAPLNESEKGKENMMSKGAWSLGINFDSKEGVKLSPSLSLDYLLNKKDKKYSLVPQQTWFDKMKTFNIDYCHKKYSDYDKNYESKKFNLSFSKHAPLPAISIPRSTISTEFSATFDGSLPVLKNKSITLKGNLSISKISEPYQEIPMYGSMYSKYGKDNKNGLMDYYRDNDGPISKESPFFSVTVNSVDIFSINASGIGGSFRLYRNEVGQFVPKYIETEATNLEINADFGAGTGAFDIGADIKFAHSKSYTGEWKNNSRINSLNHFKFNDKNVSDPLYEPSYFKLIGEGYPLPVDEYKNIDYDNPIAFDIGNWEDVNKDVFSFKAKAFSTYNKGRNNLDVNNKNARNPRTTNIESKTKKHIVSGIVRNEGVYKNKHIIKVSGRNKSLNTIAYTKGEEHHINQIAVRKTNGVVYNFALPAYNTNEEKVVFATEKPNPGATKVITFSSGDDEIKNTHGDDEYFSKEKTPPYVHSYFLTSIQSLDYIDVKNDGYTDDDPGAWTKFIYTEVDNYHWRFPFNNNEANFIDGYSENDEDNKATYTSGEKTLYYVSAIETKTHIAIFDIDDSALTEAKNYIKVQKYLKKISLYSKSDPNYKDAFYLNDQHNLSPIKEVHFNYDYSLKSSTAVSSPIPNFKTSPTTSLDNILTNNIGSSGQNGTLTLKELYFTYKKNQKGEKSRYLFDYNNDESFPIYFSEDRWGNFQPSIPLDNNINYNSYENPYTYQKESLITRNKKASLWCLNKITLPSNGAIEIDYEKDDYQYVQDKKAMEYVRIIGVGYTNGSYANLKTNDIELINLNGKVNRIYLDIDPSVSDEELAERTRGLKHLGFKAFMYLNTTKKDVVTGSRIYQDYVSGYIAKDNSNTLKLKREHNVGIYVDVNEVKPTNTAQYFLHPFQIATIQYIRNYRPDLQTSFDIESDPIQFARKNLNKLIKAIKPLFKGYIKDKATKGWGSQIKKDKPSFVRLNSYKKKYGGDNRVKQITLFPDPADRTVFYGKEYSYVLSDGISSSGVAEMEPITGHKENGLVKPEHFEDPTGNKLLWVVQNETENAFVETPFGTSFLPAANVGYSRVIERSLSPKNPSENVEKTQDGITVSEFFTAKDFPTKNKLTENPFRSIIKPINVTIPFIGSLSINNAGFTQGAAFTINNGIYGKQKRISIYPYSKDEPNGQPVSEVEYVYKTNSNNTLNNKVKFLKKEGDIVEAYLGKEYDFYLEQYESGTRTIGGGVKPDIKFSPLIYPWPSLWPTINYMESTSSYISTTKVIYNSPILEKTIQYKDGSKVISSPEYYDYETGNSIVNSVTNEFNNKIYSQSLPAQWSYPRMKGAYKNYGARLSITASNTLGQFKLVQNQIASNILFEGDEIIFEDHDNTRYYITKIDNTTNEFELKDRQNNYPNINNNVFKIAYIDRSGYRNLQSVSKGEIVFLDENNINFQESAYVSPLQSLINGYNQSQSNFISNSMLVNEDNIPHYTDVRWYLDNSITKIIYKKINAVGTINISQCFVDNFNIDFIQTKETDPNGNLILSDVYKPKIYFNGINKQCYGELDLTIINSNLLATIDCSKFRFTDEFINQSSVKMIYNHFGHPFNNQKVVFKFKEGENCFSCEENRKTIPVLQANAVEFTENFTPNFNTLPSEKTDIAGETLTNIYQNNSANPYAFGVKGIPRSLTTWAYIESRKQKGILGEGLRNDLDGEFNYYPFNWKESSVYNENYNWRWVNEITKYNANGSSEEVKNRLKMFSTNLFGYKNLLVTAAAQNAEHTDIVYDGFEDYGGLDPIVTSTGNIPAQYQDLNHGNVELPLKNNSLVGIAHTGDWGLAIERPKSIDTSNPKYFKPTNKKYLISAWVYMGDIKFWDSTTSFNGGKIEVFEDTNPTPIAIVSVDRTKNNIIDDWIKIEGEFEPSSPTSNVKIRLIPTLLSNGNTGSIFDDFRIQPFNSTMQTYVYNPEDYSLQYILNNQNYFSEFIRDSEGSLIQKNIETEEGKKTLSINRSNISKN